MSGFICCPKKALSLMHLLLETKINLSVNFSASFFTSGVKIFVEKREESLEQDALLISAEVISFRAISCNSGGSVNSIFSLTANSSTIVATESSISEDKGAKQAPLKQSSLHSISEYFILLSLQ